VARIGEPVREGAVVGEEQQPLGIAVEPSRGVDAGDVDVVGERATPCAVGELAQDVVRLVEEDQRRLATSPASRT
jgi:hypothetical protein